MVVYARTETVRGTARWEVQFLFNGELAYGRLWTTRADALAEAEANLGFPSHDAVGLRLSKRWRFPLPLQVAIANHHKPAAKDRAQVPAHLHPVIDVVSLADAICHRWGYSSHVGNARPLPAEPLERLNLTPAFEQEANDRLRRKIEHSELLIEVLGAA